MKVLVAILSAHGLEARRDAQRRTWLAELHGADYRFFLGRHVSADWMDGLILRNDFVELDCDDTYAGLPAKMRAVAAWALRYDYDYLFKCDDDTYVCPERLLACGFQGRDYSGFIEDRDCHLRAFNFPVYPHAAGGPGYWLSRKAMEFVAAGLPKKGQEDFAVGELLAKAGIRPVHDARYVHDDRRDRDDVLHSEFISLHKCDPQEMRRVHAQRQSFCPNGAE